MQLQRKQLQIDIDVDYPHYLYYLTLVLLKSQKASDHPKHSVSVLMLLFEVLVDFTFADVVLGERTGCQQQAEREQKHQNHDHRWQASQHQLHGITLLCKKISKESGKNDLQGKHSFFIYYSLHLLKKSQCKIR